MEFQILGPLEVRREHKQLALGAAKQRALLAILLIHRNELVSSDRLIEELWPEPPRTAANTLQVYVGKLRKALEPDRSPGGQGDLLLTRAPGYVLRVEAGELDADRFERMLSAGRMAREAGDHATAATLLRQALELWRGGALVDFTYDPFAQAEIARLDELRLEAISERVEADLASGKSADLVGELETLVRDNPLRERLRGQLMLALYRSGRQGDALEAYREACAVLDEQLGLAPSPPLERLQVAILRQEPALEISIEAGAGRTAPPPTEAVPTAPEVRKTVTVLAVRRQGVRGRDPEALSGENAQYDAEVARIMERYGGTVTSSLGDSVVAVFGVPEVHEDDALRAVSAALEIRDASDSGPTTSAGVATGEVLAGGPSAGRASVIGEPITAAGELEDVAAPGEVLLDPDTEWLVRRHAKADQLETAAGSAWRLRDLARERPAVGSLKAPLVGRRHEVARLRAVFDRAVREGALHMVTVLGVAGIGKSRLAQELASLAAERATVLVGRCVPYGEGITFWSLREIVGQLSDAGPSGALASALSDAIGDGEGSGEREEIFWAARGLFESLARARPLLVFFEDVHWAEPTFLDLVEYLTERVRDAPILVVCIARPELLEERPEWVDEKPNTSSLLLERLPEGDCEALVASLARTMAPATRSRVLETADGNPLFIEQLVAMLSEAAGEEAELAIPPTITALLSARLDRLGPGERAVITRAAVVGKEFSAESAAELLPEEGRAFVARHLETLALKDLIGPVSSVEGRERFRFRHILIQQVAYGTTPKRVRAELHERLAAWIGEPPRGEVAGRTEIIGYHLEQAFRYRAELGEVGAAELELARRASRHLAAAGQRAFRRGDMPATANLLGRAASLPVSDGDGGLSVLPELGFALFEIGEVEEASALLADARARAHAAGDRHLEWRVAITGARVEMYRDPGTIELDVLAAETETAVEVLAEFGDEAGLARAWMVLSDVHWSKGRLRETSDAASRAAELARRTGNRREVGWSLGQIALCAIHGPMPVAEGLAWLGKLLAGEPENRTLDANLSGFVTLLEAMSGRFDEARRHIKETRALARDLGLTWQGAVQELLSGYIELLAGDPVAAERDMRSAGEAFREIGEGWFLSTVAVDLPRAVYEQGRYDDAFALLNAIEETAAPPDREWQIKRTGVPARLLARRGRLEEAEALARGGVALAADSEFVVLQADVLLDLSEVLSLAGRPADAAASAAEALSLYERKGNVASASRARSVLPGGRAPT
jgi:DNA-binding SARP family transcriptional activator/class 3 adenylate cyclase